MRVFFTYLLEDEARDFHAALIEEVADLFKVPSLNDKVGPHVTLKEAFDIVESDWKVLDPALAAFAAGQKAVTMSLGPWGCFGRDVIFRAVDPSIDFVGMHGDLLALLCEHPVVFGGHDAAGSAYHVTVAKDVASIFDDVWAKVSSVPVKNETLFMSALAACLYEDRKWKTLAMYPMKRK